MTGEANQSVMLSNNTMYPSVLSLTLNSLLPGTNYNISTSAVYPSGQFILSNASSFRTNGMCLRFSINGLCISLFLSR